MNIVKFLHIFVCLHIGLFSIFFCDFLAKGRVKQQNSTDFLPDELLVALGEPLPAPQRVGLSTRLPDVKRSTVCSY